MPDRLMNPFLIRTLKTAVAAALAMVTLCKTRAEFIDGNLFMTGIGFVTLNPISGIGIDTQLTVGFPSGINAVVTDTTGDFDQIFTTLPSYFTLNSFTTDSSPFPNFCVSSDPSVSFDLTTASVITSATSILVVGGTGQLHAEGFDQTPAKFSLTITQPTLPFDLLITADPPPALVLTCPGNILTSADPDVCGVAVTFALPTANLTGVTITCDPPSGSVFPLGSTTVNCEGVDGFGRHATCSFMVVVEDDTEPDITSPPDITVGCLAGIPTANFSGGAVADACDPAPVVTHIKDLQTGSNPTVITRTYQAKDATGNVSFATQRITVEVQPGDFNADCCVDKQDRDLLVAAMRSKSPDSRFDLDHNGKINGQDVLVLTQLYSLPGGKPCAP